ncbi:MAG: OsmC family protein [Sandaracinaceae bacterium]
MHRYAVTVRWTGNRGEGTSAYRAYGREHVVQIAGKEDLLGSSDPVYRGDASLHNPEDLFVAALSSCHMLWFLHLACRARMCVVGYTDEALGELRVHEDGGGSFARVRLRPRVTVRGAADEEALRALHDEAHAKCFISQSVKCPVEIVPSLIVAEG